MNSKQKNYLYHLTQNKFSLLCADNSSHEELNKLITIINLIAEQPVVTDSGDFFIDLALFPHHGENFSTLYKNAHTALNIAAAEKYQNSVIFNDEFAKALHTSAAMVEELRNALSNDEFFWFFSHN